MTVGGDSVSGYDVEMGYTQYNPERMTCDEWMAVWVKAQPETLAGIRRGLMEYHLGNVTSWAKVKKDLGLSLDSKRKQV